MPAGEEEDKFAVAWFKPDATTTTLSANASLFKLKVKTLQPVSDMNDALQLEHPLVESAFFLATGCKSAVELQASVELLEDEKSEERNKGYDGSSKPQIQKLYCHPNPVSNTLNVYFDSQADDSGVLIFNSIHGQILQSIPVTIRAGVNHILIGESQMESFPEGIFTLSLRSSTGMNTVKLSRK